MSSSAEPGLAVVNYFVLGSAERKTTEVYVKNESDELLRQVA
jgi:hypothetical protein